MTERTWTIEWLGRPQSLNAERAGNRFKSSAMTKQVRFDCKVLTRIAKVPKLSAMKIIATPVYPDGRWHTDVGNVYPTVKAAIDGIVDAGVVPDDKAKYLRELTFRPPTVEKGSMLLRIEIVEVLD